jgi:hypothetical protein
MIPEIILPFMKHYSSERIFSKLVRSLFIIRERLVMP